MRFIFLLRVWAGLFAFTLVACGGEGVKSVPSLRRDAAVSDSGRLPSGDAGRDAERGEDAGFEDSDAGLEEPDAAGPHCGDGVVQGDEACDNGDANSDSVADACRSNCTSPRCGDGVTDSAEECDSGAANSNTVPNACRVGCRAPSCGDGVLDSSEVCDSGRANSNSIPDACRTTCVAPSCGDGVVDLGEVCDDDGENSDVASDACRTTCVPPRCGDGVIDTSEECDNGTSNSNTVSDACRTSCRAARCGDGVHDSSEGCDDGARNSDVVANACRTACMLPTCGDGVVDLGELCDTGSARSDVDPDACRLTCVPHRCGDGVVDSSEQCDSGPGNSDTTADACRTRCRLPSCGDGIADSSEECDEGASNSNTMADACRTTCQRPRCGDGVHDSGEACDDGNLEAGDGCSLSCSIDCASWGTTSPLLLEANRFDFSQTGEGGMSVAAWLLPTSSAGGTIFRARDDSNIVQISLINGRVFVELGGLAPSVEVFCAACDFSKPTHLAFAYIGVAYDWSWTMYLDGNPVGSGAGNAYIPSITSSEHPGWNQEGAFVLDDVRGWNTVLSTSEVREVYNAGAGTPDRVRPENTLFQYEFQEGSGASAGNSHGPYGPVAVDETRWIEGLVVPQPGPCSTLP